LLIASIIVLSYEVETLLLGSGLLQLYIISAVVACLLGQFTLRGGGRG
jgi:hypothetical protein